MSDVSARMDDLTYSLSKNRDFRRLLVKLAGHLKEGDLSRLKFFLKDTIPAGKMEGLKKPLQLFNELEERDIVGLGKLDELRNLLEDIERPHLISMVDDFDDSRHVFPLKPKSENYLEFKGYQLSVKGGRHFGTTVGEFVEVQSGANYEMLITNMNSHRCICMVRVDGYEMFPIGLMLYPKHQYVLQRPSGQNQKFKFFAVADAPEGSGINLWRKEQNGLIEVVFTPERADMKITCIAKGKETRVLTCSTQATDSDFHKMVATAFDAADGNVTLIVDGWKPLGKRDVKLGEYGIKDGTRIDVNLGGKGGVSFAGLRSTQNQSAMPSSRDPKWRAGATTLEDDCDQKFVVSDSFPLDPLLSTSLNLRLVARHDQRRLPSTGRCVPLARSTLIPPPVPV